MRLLIGLAALVLVGGGLWAMLAPESFYAALAAYPPFGVLRALIAGESLHETTTGSRLQSPCAQASLSTRADKEDAEEAEQPIPAAVPEQSARCPSQPCRAGASTMTCLSMRQTLCTSAGACRVHIS